MLLSWNLVPTSPLFHSWSPSGHHVGRILCVACTAVFQLPGWWTDACVEVVALMGARSFSSDFFGRPTTSKSMEALSCIVSFDDSTESDLQADALAYACEGVEGDEVLASMALVVVS